MAQGAELDLIDVRYYTNSSRVYFVDDNEPLQDINTNILKVDNKAVLAKNTANQVTADFAAHQGGGGTGVHTEATPYTSGFMSAADKVKLDSVAVEAQLNILSPSDALELVSRQATLLHTHPAVTTLTDGFMSSADKTKLNGIEAGAKVNNISDANAAILTGGPSENAESLHTHVVPVFVETFDYAAHQGHDHTGISGMVPYTGLLKSPFFSGPTSSGSTVIFIQDFAFTPVSVHAGIRVASATSVYPFYWGAGEEFIIDDLEVDMGNNRGILTYRATGGLGSLSCWMGAYGVA